MRKKNFFVLGLTLFISISSASCDIDGFIDQANTYLSSVNSWIGEAGENIGNWWEQTYSNLDDWWNKAEDDFSSWWSNTKNSAADLYNEINNKLLETYDYLVCKTDETIDDMVGAVASAIKRSYSKNFESIVPVSNRSFDNISIDEFTEEMFYNDELFAYDEEAFVYKLVRSIIPTSYETFPAVLIVEEDEEILGLAYADYSKIFESDDLKYVPTGFIAFESEAPLYEEYLNYTYEIKRLDGFDEGYSYFLSYLPESYKTHCVALNKYFVFGIDENYKIFYSINDYVSSNVEKLGKLYSFDKNDFIANLNEDSYFGNTNLVEQIKYFSRSETEIKAELYDYFKNFSINVKEFDIKNIFGLVKGSVNDVFGANNIVSSISNLTIEDIFDTKIDMDQIPTSSSLFPKWAIITGCVLSIIVSIAISIFIPQLNIVSGAVIGATVELFLETIIEKKDIANVDCRKLIISAAAGAISANLNILGDSAVGGITESIFTVMDGGTVEQTFKSFLTGMVSGIVLGTAFELLSKLATKALMKIAPDFLYKTSKFINEHQIVIGGKKASAVDNVVTSKTNTGVSNQIDDIVNDVDFNSELQKKAYKSLPNPEKNNKFKYYDLDFNETNKTMNGYIKATDNVSDDFKKALKNQDGELIEYLEVKNGFINFDDLGYPKVRLEELSIRRDINFTKADDLLAKQFSKNINNIPEEFSLYLLSKGVDLNNIKGIDIAELREVLNYVWHESQDIGLLILLPRCIHNGPLGGVTHYGGRGIVKLAKAYSYDYAPLLGYVNKFVI